MGREIAGPFEFLRIRKPMKPITVFGGSGFLGRRIVLSLAAGGAAVRVAVRHPERASRLEGAAGDGTVELVRADVWDEKSVARAVKDSVPRLRVVVL